MEMPRGFCFQAEDGIRDYDVTGVQTCALPIFCADAPAQRLGHPAPAIDLEHAFQGPNAEAITLESLRGKLLVLEFWATW